MIRHSLYALAGVILLLFLAACDQMKQVGDMLGMEPPPQSRHITRDGGGTATTAEPDAEEVTVRLLHLNDFHSQLDPYYTSDEPEQGSAGRLKTVIERLRAERGPENTLLLFGGDAFQGTMFYNTWKGSAEVMVMNELGFDAVCLGNHEFDSGPAELARALTGGPITIGGTEYATEKAGFLVLTTNVDVSKEPELEAGSVKRAVITKNGVRYGLLGVTTTTTANVSSPGENVQFLDYVASVQQEADALRAEGVDKVFLMSHSGTDVDMKMVPLLSGVDVIVGGHDHALFGDAEAIRAMGLPKQADAVVAPYPAVLADRDGNTVLLVSAFEKGRWVGNIDITFDGAGKVAAWDGKPVFMRGCTWHKDSTGKPVADDCTAQVAEADPVMQAKVEQYRIPLDKVANRPLGETTVAFSGRHAAGAAGVHSMGNLTADIILDYAKPHQADAAVVNRGGMRADLPKGPVRYSDINTVLPFDNTVTVVQVTGAELLEAMDVAVSEAGGKSYGAFPHVSHNMHIEYCADSQDCDEPLLLGGRITDIEINGKDIEAGRTYRIATNDYLAKGGDFYTVFKDACAKAAGNCVDTEARLRDVVADWFASHSPVGAVSQDRVEAD